MAISLYGILDKTHELAECSKKTKLLTEERNPLGKQLNNYRHTIDGNAKEKIDIVPNYLFTLKIILFYKDAMAVEVPEIKDFYIVRRCINATHSTCLLRETSYKLAQFNLCGKVIPTKIIGGNEKNHNLRSILPSRQKPPLFVRPQNTYFLNFNLHISTLHINHQRLISVNL